MTDCPRPASPFVTALFTALLTALCCVAFAASAHATDDPDALGLQIRSPVQVGSESPAIIVNPTLSVKKLTLKLTPKSAGRSVTLRASDIRRGGQKTLEFKQAPGTIEWIVKADVTYGTGARGTFQIEISTTVYPKLAMRLTRADVNLAERQLIVRLNQPASKVDLKVTGDNGEVIHEETTEFTTDEPGAELLVGWDQPAGVAVLKLEVRAWSSFGFWAGTEITPFEIDIPHEDVEFDSGKSAVRPGEEPKLDHTLTLLAEKLKLYGGLVKLQLYIGGYTDTVGSKSSNKELSEKRARAIGSWFKRRGIPIPIFYQGFGEDAPAVKTPDETAEQKNRRALYVLSANPPTSQSAMPSRAWKRL
ncbi:MAG: outer membrane protein OmpA-like peptidoglycan-associated protein [Myxococcota bacterium]|jgi:outer membrane protein OmpA-like peptidoglycan-associated protein